MGTRSVIARPLDNGWEGRYSHWDGYPTNQATEIYRIVKTHGLERAIQVLIEENCGWSQLTDKPEIGPGYDDGRFKAVENFGVAYVENFGVAYVPESGQGSMDDWIRNTGDSWGTEWAYVLNETHLTVLEFRYGAGGWRERGIVRWDQPLSREALVLMEQDLEEVEA